MDHETTAGLAVQIVFEYEGWGPEHVWDMLQTYDDCGEERPCSADDLYGACQDAQQLKDRGHDYEEVERLVKAGLPA